jgi:phosphoglycolate phosphatase
MTHYSLAIFDFDGTLADSFLWFCSVLNQTARKFGFREVAGEDIDELRLLGSREIVARLGVPMWKMPAIAMHMCKLAASQSTISLFPGASEAISALAERGMKIAVVSSNGEDTVRRTLGASAVRVQAFDCGASLWGKSAKFKAIAQKLETEPSRTVAIGDEVRDIEAARRAGMSAGAVTFGYNSPAARKSLDPDFLFADFNDLLTQLLPSRSIN